MFAKVIIKQGKMTPNGRERVYEIRKGRKGTGELVSKVIAWPWSGVSLDKANDILGEIAEREGLDLLAPDGTGEGW